MRPNSAAYLLASAVGLLVLAIGVARAEGLSVFPINIHLGPGQLATTLTVTNQDPGEMSIQVRAYTWTQPSGDRLAATDAILASPPFISIPAGASQVVRLMLRRPPAGREATYRILLDQIPPPGAPGVVRIALRLSIPIFADPPTRIAPHVQWRIETAGGQAELVAINDGNQHQVVRDLALEAPGGAAPKLENALPYILAGATRRWRILAPGPVPAPGTTLRLTAHSDAGDIDQPIPVIAGH